jgi:enolase
MEKIRAVSAIKILNSRSEETIKVEVKSENFKASFSVPQGKSKGKYEAISLSTDNAIKSISKLIVPKILGKEVNFQDIDKTLLESEGTLQKKVFGANAILGVSIALAKIQAKIEKKPLYEFLSQFLRKKGEKPRLLMNLINGGIHSFGGPEIQEYLIILKTETFNEGVFLGSEIYRRLGETLKTNIGDEGGYVKEFENSEEPLKILKEIIEREKVESNVSIGLDVAASQLFNGENYELDNKNFSKEKIEDFYLNLSEKYKINYLEDPFYEDDFESFKNLKAKIKGCLVVGDDLTVTNVNRLKEAIKEDSISGVIIKPNQIGTLTETIKAINLATENNIDVIISHRSGETNDSFISDLSVACGAWGIKTGAPARGERVAKYNRLLEIEKEKLT